MSPQQKIRHWAEQDPWERMKLPKNVEVRQNDVLHDADFNVIRMPLFLRPCFGQPTAFARHGGVQPIVSTRTGPRPSRCMRCAAKDACENTAKARLRSDPTVKAANARFQNAGGAYGLKHPKDCPTAAKEFAGLVSALVATGGFTSSNDAYAIAELDRLAVRRRERDAERHRQDRRREIRGGRFTTEFDDLLEGQRKWREVQLMLATKDDRLPRQVYKLPLASATITADLWLVRLRKALRNEPINPSALAHGLISAWPDRYALTQHNVLRQRIPADLRRIDILERTRREGNTDPIWPPFRMNDALNELDALTPYTGGDDD